LLGERTRPACRRRRPAVGLVAQVSNLPYRRLPVGPGGWLGWACGGLETRDTADQRSALRRLGLARLTPPPVGSGIRHPVSGIRRPPSPFSLLASDFWLGRAPRCRRRPSGRAAARPYQKAPASRRTPYASRFTGRPHRAPACGLRPLAAAFLLRVAWSTSRCQRPPVTVPTRGAHAPRVPPTAGRRRPRSAGCQSPLRRPTAPASRRTPHAPRPFRHPASGIRRPPSPS